MYFIPEDDSRCSCGGYWPTLATLGFTYEESRQYQKIYR